MEKFQELAELPPQELIEGFHGKVIHTEKMTIIHWDIEAGAPLPAHSHPHEQVANVLDGQFEITIDGETQTLKPGSVAVIPSNAIHSGKAITRCSIIDVFSPPRDDYKNR